MIDIPNAHAIRLTRLAGNTIVEYEAVTFPRNPRAGCLMWLRRCEACGYIVNRLTGWVIDILDTNGDIIQEFNVTRRGFGYLRRSLKFRRERENAKGAAR